MNQHLSEEQISRWILGERTAAGEQHVRKCASCWNEIARVEAALSEFRGSLRNWSEQQKAPAVTWQAGRARRRFFTRPVRWALIAATALMLGAIPFYQAREQRRRAELARADTALMEQVDAGISRAVAEPMQPLVNLVAWDGASTEGKNR